MLINILLAAVYFVLLGLVVYKVFYKRLELTVTRFPNYLVLAYQLGFKKGTAQFTVSSDVFKPTVTRNFNRFNIIVPMEMSYDNVITWLRNVQIDEIYSRQGIEGFELMRSLLLREVSNEVKELNVTTTFCNRLALLTFLRKNRSLTKQLVTQLMKPDTRNIVTPKSPRLQKAL